MIKCQCESVKHDAVHDDGCHCEASVSVPTIFGDFAVCQFCKDNHIPDDFAKVNRGGHDRKVSYQGENEDEPTYCGHPDDCDCEFCDA